MKFKFLATLALVAASPSISLAQEEQGNNAVLRMKMPSEIIFLGDTTNPPDSSPNNGPLIISIPQLRAWATVGDAFSPIVINGGVAPYSVSLVEGALPPGLSLLANQVQGIYASPGLYSFKFGASDSNSPPKSGDTALFDVEVANPLTIGEYGQVVYQATVGQQMILPAPAVTGGTPSYTFSAANLSPDTQSGEIRVTPNAVGTTPVLLEVQDHFGRTDTAATAINTSAQLSASYPQGHIALRIGTQSSIQPPTVSGGRGVKTFSGASLPPGLTMDNAGLITGIPATADTGTLSTTVSDTDGRTANATRSWTVNPEPMTINGLSSNHAASMGQQFTLTATAAGSIGTVTWTQLAGRLPQGLSFSNGTISGIPTAMGAESGIRIQATDDLGSVSSEPFSITVAGEYSATVVQNTANVALPGTYFTAAEWSANIPKRLVVPAGVTVYSETSTPALTVSNGFSNTVTIENSGTIIGGPGSGGIGGKNSGASSGQDGNDGFPAIRVSQGGLHIDNRGAIYGGAGGGSGGGIGGKGQYGAVGGSFSSDNYVTTSTNKYYCRYAMSESSTRFQIYWGNVRVYSSATQYGNPQLVDGQGAFRCTTTKQTPSTTQVGFYAVQRANATTVVTDGGDGGDGGRGQSFLAPMTNGGAGLPGGTGAGTGGGGGNGGSKGTNGFKGAIGSNGNAASGATGYGSGVAGLAGYVVDRGSVSITWINNGTRVGRIQ